MSERWLHVGEPVLAGREEEYVLDALRSGWVSSLGPYVQRFEEHVAALSGQPHALAVVNGTAALHIALLALDVGPGDEVIVPTLAYVAVANAVTYCGARPVFVDAGPDGWNAGPEAVAAALSPRTKAIVVVHLYGHPVDLDPVCELARARGIPVVEDAAEAHGAEYKGRPVGSFGTVATWSFYGNKVITTGEGGAVACSDPALLERMRQLHGQGQDPGRRYWFPVVGFNYRMTNIAAAIGVAQFERLPVLLERRREVRAWYRELLGADPRLAVAEESAWAKDACWMTGVVLRGAGAERRDAVMARLLADRIESRPFFPPLHVLPPYRREGVHHPVSERLADDGLCLPSAASLERADVERVAASLLRGLEATGA